MWNKAVYIYVTDKVPTVQSSATYTYKRYGYSNHLEGYT